MSNQKGFSIVSALAATAIVSGAGVLMMSQSKNASTDAAFIQGRQDASFVADYISSNFKYEATCKLNLNLTSTLSQSGITKFTTNFMGDLFGEGSSVKNIQNLKVKALELSPLELLQSAAGLTVSRSYINLQLSYQTPKGEPRDFPIRKLSPIQILTNASGTILGCGTDMTQTFLALLPPVNPAGPGTGNGNGNGNNGPITIISTEGGTITLSPPTASCDTLCQATEWMTRNPNPNSTLSPEQRARNEIAAMERHGINVDKLASNYTSLRENLDSGGSPYTTEQLDTLIKNKDLEDPNLTAEQNWEAISSAMAGMDTALDMFGGDVVKDYIDATGGITNNLGILQLVDQASKSGYTEEQTIQLVQEVTAKYTREEIDAYLSTGNTLADAKRDGF